MSRLIQCVRATLADWRGVASVELGVIALPILLFIMLPTYDLGNVILQQIKCVEAVRAGGQYTLSFPTDTQGISNTVTAAVQGTGWTDAPAVTSQQSQNGYLVTITLSHSYTPLTPFFDPKTFLSPSASYVVRVQ